MEYIKKEELIEGEIYVFDNKFINKIQNGHLNIKCWISIPEEYFYKNSSNNQTNNIINATPEEKHWLNCCITADKFITFEEAMKTFIPEYVEDISNKHSSSEIIGTIYKTSELPKWVKGHELEEYWKAYMFHYKPSTKEAYDAQFVVIEPLPQFKVIETIETITKVENNEGNQFFIGDVVKTEAGLHFKIIGFKYDENKTKILAIATDNYPEVVKDINDIEHYIEPKVIEPEFVLPEKWCITTTEESQNIIFDWFKKNTNWRDSPGKNITIGNHYCIEGKICTGWMHYAPDRKIGYEELTFDQFKKYVLKEEVKEETLLEKAKRLYPVGTKFINPNDNRECVIKEKGNYFKGNNNIYHSIANTIFKYEEGLSGCIYINNTWSKIIE